MKLFIMRGIPGSGKTYLARKIALSLDHQQKQREIVSADSYFENYALNGGFFKYTFNPSKLNEAHKMCFNRAYNAMIARKCVIVDNTNTNHYEMAPYIALGELFDYEIKIMTIECPVGVAFNRQSHDVPRSTLERMVEQLGSPLPRHWQIYHQIVSD